MMLRNITLTAAIAALALPVMAQNGTPGANFIQQWDSDGDGRVTLVEARERRSDMFALYDADENGRLDASELADMDAVGSEMREAMQGDRQGSGHGRGQGMGKGMGQGMAQGTGHGQGLGRGMGQGMGQAQAMGHGQGQGRGNHDHTQFDTDTDGFISLAEFETGTDDWFEMRDRDGDGAITTGDFGLRR